jgi:5'-3' exonuclease
VAEEELSERCAVDTSTFVCFGDHGWREAYYQHKLGIAPTDAAARRRVCVSYLKGLCWVLRYYYQGVPSWTWFYAYHYAPPASDLIGALLGGDPTPILSFEPGEPLAPLEQLTAVLPPLSAAALPPPLAHLLKTAHAASSPLAASFPEELRLDLNGAAQLWKAVVLLPFLDAAALHAAFEQAKRSLSPEDAARNRFGPMYLYLPPSDPLAPELWSLAKTHARIDGYAMAKVAHPPRGDDSLGALLTPYPSVPHGARRAPPSPRLEAVEFNRVASCVLRLPPPKLHTSALLPNVTLRQTLHPSAQPCESYEEDVWRRKLLKARC